MAIVCQCPACGRKFKVEDKFAGRKAKCGDCGNVTVIPSPAETEAKTAVEAEASSSDRAPIAGGDSSAAEKPREALPLDRQPEQPSSEGQLPQVAAARPAALARRRNSKGKKGGKLWLIAGAGLAVVLLAASAAAFFVLGGSEAALVFDWPPADRVDARLQIDGRNVKVSHEGGLRFPLPPGDHQVSIKRRGFEPIEFSLALEGGEEHRYAPQWKKSDFAAIGASDNDNEPQFTVSSLAPTGFEGWSQHYNGARRRAQESGKDLLIVFGGSDWSPETQELAHGALHSPEFTSLAEERFELVVIDFPRTEQGFNLIEDREQNAGLQEQFHIMQLPTLVLADDQGRPYAIDESPAEHTDRFVEHVRELVAQRAERDRLFEAANSGAEAETLEAAEEAVAWLEENQLLAHYGQHVSRWHSLARRLDPNNEQGKQEKFFEADWLARLARMSAEDASRLPQIVADLKRWTGEQRFQDPDRGARLHLIAAGVLAQLEEPETAVRYVEGGLAYDPASRELRDQLAAAEQALSRADVLGSGTGFVVNSGGFLLTNHHVIEGPGRAFVRFPSGEERPAKIVARDAASDMALLQIDPPADEPLAPLSIASANVGRGADVAVFGYPLNDVVGMGLKLTTGVVSGLPDKSGDGMLLLDCRVNPGNSGGPLCDARGQVIGMVTAKSGNGMGIDSYGMALPAADLHAFLKENLLGYTPAEAPQTAVLSWGEVDRAVSPSVLMVVKKR